MNQEPSIGWLRLVPGRLPMRWHDNRTKEDHPVSTNASNYPSLTPYLVVRGAARAIDFYRHAFGAREVLRVASPDGKSIVHAEIRLGDSSVMLTDERLDRGARSPLTVGGTASSIYLLVEDADAQFHHAIAAGASRKVGLSDAFWGHRWGVLTDPFGHDWQIASPRESLGLEQVQQRAKAQLSTARID